ncbi:hypothetical protein C2S53_008034 [Perilla frutescens var. hirtella]|uniref:NB-ARC domain-containing protein n=1 Tax=Perilla frutescens var. hirtella TaxID=608512 RepID=A0AAD4J2N6_PERFH|nr:hypothetical protein C2S53_008034 [Perilla frutescens var. hirtella]
MAYAAAISLKHTIDRLMIYFPMNSQIMESAYKELELLQIELKRLDDIDSCNRSVINALDAEIREAVCTLEDVMESYSQGVGDEKAVELEICSFLKTVKKLKWNYNRELKCPSSTIEEDETDNFGGNKSTTVGLSDQSEKIRNELLDWHSEYSMVSLVGMAGIGKTHLAREVYEHPLIVQGFDFTAWVSVGPTHQIKNVWVDIAAQIECKPRNLYMGKDMFALHSILKENLQGRKYLIVLDDIWSTKVCESLISWLPANGNRRRFLLTTRLEGVAEYHGSSIHQMRFLSNTESWDLLSQNLFVHKSFPPQLEKVGRKIAENCEGLPLLILAVASILCGLDKTEEYWTKVADRKTTTFSEAYEKISKVLVTSYEYLPQHLKACFLYMGVFPRSSEIFLPKLINLWTVEDFLEPNHSQTSEDFAMVCLKDIVSNSLAIVCKQSLNYIIKSCKLHSAYWHLCVKEARENKLFHVLNKLTDCFKDYMESHRRLSIQNNILFGIREARDSMATTLKARSLLCTGEDHEYPVPICLNLMSLKVLDALAIRFYEFPGEVVKLLQLRYLALTHNGKPPPSISKLQQLQCLIFRQYHNIKMLPEERLRFSTFLPEDVWNMQELRHLGIMGSNLPDPSKCAELPNLLTLDVNADSCTEEVFRSIPHLKKLGIKVELQPDAAETLSCFQHIGVLNELELLECVVVNPRLRSQVVAPPEHLSNLPWGLKELSLNGLGYPWKYMSAIGSLPNLQVLKLRCSAFQGAEWYSRIGEFEGVKYLLLEDIDLVDWTTDNVICTHYGMRRSFQQLRRLMIRHCYKLKMIPLPIGSVPTLETIEVVDCSPSIFVSYLKHPPQVVINNSSWIKS